MSASETAPFSSSLARPAGAVRFCQVWFCGVIALALLAALVNVAIDPFLVFGAPRVTGFNALKPASVLHEELGKTHLFARGQWAGLALGTSKVDIGLDPDSPRWPESMRPVFNDGIPGMGLPGILARLRRELHPGSVRRVLVMLELPDFMGLPAPAVSAPENLSALAGWRDAASDMAQAALSMDALRASLWTLAAQHGQNVADLSANGGMSDAGFREAAAAQGAEALFVQKESTLGPRIGWLGAAARQTPPAPTANLDTLSALIALCRQRGVVLDLAFAPFHADYLDLLDRAGAWPRYLKAKTDITRLVAERPSDDVRLWDFMGYDAYSTEPVPGPGDRSGATHWFWEPGHFRRALGEQILATIYNGSTEYGRQLTEESLPVRLQEDEHARRAHRAAAASDARLTRAGFAPQ